MTRTPVSDPTTPWRTVVRSQHPAWDWLPDGVHVSDHEHDTFDQARRAGLQATCWTSTQAVEVFSPEGVLECSWRAEDERGERDNQWHAVGPLARAQHDAEQAAIYAEMTQAGRRNVRGTHRR